MTRCQFVLSPAFGSNLLFFGDQVLFEGHKTEVERGFGWTQVFTDANYLGARIRVFDKFFESARTDTLRLYGQNSPGKAEQELLADAVLNGLTEARSKIGR